MDYYRLDVITESVQEAIHNTGGLMFDRLRAGWRVAVVTDDVAHPRALAILGIASRALGYPDEQHTQGVECLTTVSQLSGCGPNRGSGAGSALLHWGRHPAIGAPPGDLRPLAHPLSAAARAFKAQALRCIGLDAEVEPYEHFWADATAGVGPFGEPLPVADRPALAAVATPGRSRSSTVMGGWPGG